MGLILANVRLSFYTRSMVPPPARSTPASRWHMIACDLDGTLIGWNHKINPADLSALARARAAGFHVAICTGRNSRESAGVIAALDLKGPGVFVNGAMVCSTLDGSALHSTYLSDPLCDEIIDFFGSQDHAVLVLADDTLTRLPVYCLTDHAPPHAATVDWLLYNRMHAQPVPEMPVNFRGRCVRLGVVVNVDLAASLHAAVQARFAGRCATHSIYSPHYDCQIIELFHPSVNKWTGLQHLAEALDIPPASIIAIGDDINDPAMLEGAALSFAMGNASEQVKAHAKRVAPAQADCGVAHVIYALLEGRLESP